MPNLQPVSDAEIAEWKQWAGEDYTNPAISFNRRILRLIADRERVERFLYVAIGPGRCNCERLAHFGRRQKSYANNYREHVEFNWPHEHKPSFAEAIHAIQKGEEPK